MNSSEIEQTTQLKRARGCADFMRNPPGNNCFGRRVYTLACG
jgi:hypothetical protein